MSAGHLSSTGIFFHENWYISGSTEQSPRLSDAFTLEHHETTEYPQFVQGETQIKEDLADAMRESPAVSHDLPGMFKQIFINVFF